MEHNDEMAVPTACTLDADHARRRVARWHALSERIPPMVTQLGPETIEVHYSATPDVIAELTSLAALEADCCAFLTFVVHEARDEAILTVKAAPGTAPDVAQSLSALTSSITGRTQVSIDPDA